MSEPEIDARAALARMFGHEEPEEEVPPAEMARLLLKAWPIYCSHMCPQGEDYSPWVLGTLITPRKDTYVRDPGTPYIVLDGWEVSEPLFAAEQGGSMRDGFMPNIRIGRWTPVGLAAMWVESWAFEDYTGEIASDGESPAPVS